MGKKRRQIRSRCQGCGGSGMVWVEKMGVHSSDKKRSESVRVQDPCKQCGGRGFHVTFVEE